MHLRNILPEEILLEIFSEIDKKDLRKFLEINSEWRNLMIKNVKVMRKLPLILINDTWTGKLDFVEKYGKFIRQVEFVDAVIDSFEDVKKVLRLTPNVEKVSLINLKIKEKPEEGDENSNENGEKLNEKVFMRNLKTVVVQDKANIGALEFIASQLVLQMTSLKCDLYDDSNRSTLEQIMTDNRELRSLEVFTTIDEIFNPTEDVLNGFTCRLEKLLVKSTMLMFNDHFVRFLKSQQHLKQIGLIASHVDFRYQQMMFTTFPTVKNVHLNIDALSTSDCLQKLRKFPSNSSIESLSLFGQNLHMNIFDAVLKLSPKICQLNIENMTHFYSETIRQLPLTHLRVDRAKKEFVSPEQLTQSAKIQLTEVIPIQKEVYERNLQNFCDFTRFSDKTRNVIEAF